MFRCKFMCFKKLFLISVFERVNSRPIEFYFFSSKWLNSFISKIVVCKINLKNLTSENPIFL